MTKKILLTLAACALVLSACKNTIPDPQELLREAFENAFSIDSAIFSASGNVQIENVENTNGEVKFIFEGKGENLLEFPPKVDYSIRAEFNFQNPETGSFTGSGKFSIKMLEDAIFAKLENVEFTGNPELEATKSFIQTFSGKWHKFSLENFANINPKFEATFAQQQKNQQKFLEFYKKLLNENDILLAENLREDGKNFVIEVEPNFDLIFSENFLNNTRSGLLELVKEIDKNTFSSSEFDEELCARLPEIREIAKKVWQTGNFKITMKIGKENRIAHTSIVSGNFDLAEFNKIIPEEMQKDEASGKVIFNFISESSNFNQPQNITPPEDFIDFDPAMLFGAMQIPPSVHKFEDEDFSGETIPFLESGKMPPSFEPENFIPSLPAESEKVPTEKNQPVARPNQTELTDQEKCEDSGGKWNAICPDCVGCPCEYYCDCQIERKVQDNTTLIRAKLEENNECISCQTDFDCRFINCVMMNESDCTPKQCGMARNICIDIKQECIHEVCVITEKKYGLWDDRTHDCINNECVPCGDACITK